MSRNAFTPRNFPLRAGWSYFLIRMLFAIISPHFFVQAFSASPIIETDIRKPFLVMAFYTGKEEPPHISFLNDADRWFPEMGKKHGFTYRSTHDWTRLNKDSLSQYDVVIFLDTRPEAPEQRLAFQRYMENGGAWMGFHFSGFALTPSAFNQDWEWYHDYFIAAGQYVSNTWRPTSAILRVENKDHPANNLLPQTFRSAPNEWYRWQKDLRQNPDIDILLAIDSTSFPLGTGPKPHEIWHEGYYPVAWSNRKFRMVYMNMGHDDMDFGPPENRALSSTFSSPEQDQFIINALCWLGNTRNK